MCIYAYVVDSVSKKSTHLRNNKKTELSNILKQGKFLGTLISFTYRIPRSEAWIFFFNRDYLQSTYNLSETFLPPSAPSIYLDPIIPPLVLYIVALYGLCR